MIPQKILQYLDDRGVAYQRRPHARMVTAQELAASLHVTGYRVAKSVLVAADDTSWIVVLPAAEVVDRARLARALGARRVRFLNEQEFAAFFPDCEVGAEPPFGTLYRLPVAVDRSLTGVGRLVLRAGSHEEAIEMQYDDYARLESPRVGEFAVPKVAIPKDVEGGRWV